MIVVGAGVTLNATADVSGRCLSRITWTGLIRNSLDYLINDGYVYALNRRARRTYEALKDPDTDSLLDAANILSSQLARQGQISDDATYSVKHYAMTLTQLARCMINYEVHQWEIHVFTASYTHEL